MRRIEETAHRPAAGWDPVVGYGVVDAMAAVSGGATTATDRQSRPSRALSTPDATTADNGGHRFAVGGAAVCLAVSLVTVAVTVSSARLRRSREGVTHD